MKQDLSKQDYIFFVIEINLAVSRLNTITRSAKDMKIEEVIKLAEEIKKNANLLKEKVSS